METIMKTIIDLASEILVDRSRVGNPYLRLLLAAIGQELARGSAWVAIHKQIAPQYEFFLPLIVEQLQYVSA